MTNKHVSSYYAFLLEQDMMAGAPPVAPPKVILYHFLFMTGSDDAGNSRRVYPDKSAVIEYPCYSLDLPTLESWVKDNIVSTEKTDLNKSELDIRQKNLIDIVKGNRTNISNDDLPYIEKLKNAVSANLIGRHEPEVTVVFSGGAPTTSDINVTFIKHKK
jgi:hypothetical protein